MSQFKFDDARDKRVTDFLQEVVEVSRRHGVLLSHEDSHGGFIVERRDDTRCANGKPWSEECEEWLLAAMEKVQP